jgi:hypothetical protein
MEGPLALNLSPRRQTSFSFSSTLDLTGQVSKLDTEQYYFAYGGFANVWKARWIRNDEDPLEVQIFLLLHDCSWSYKRRWQSRSSEDLEIAQWTMYCSICNFVFLPLIFNQKLLREVRVWSSVHHQNITPFLGISFDFERPGTSCLISPYYRNGNISSYSKGQPMVDKVALVGYIVEPVGLTSTKYDVRLSKLPPPYRTYTAWV